MTRYIVYLPPIVSPAPLQETALLQEKAVFVREGFSWGGFLLAPFWFFAQAGWRVGALILFAFFFLPAATAPLGFSEPFPILIFVFVSFLCGLEAASLERLGLLMQGYKDVCVIVAKNIEEAEQRFYHSSLSVFSAPVAHREPLEGINPFTPPPREKASVIGLFPQNKANNQSYARFPLPSSGEDGSKI